MQATTTDTSKVLNGLIETCKDGEEGFRQAAEKVNLPTLKSLFLRYAAQRASYVQELQAIVSLLGETPQTSGHISANLHRGWIGLKAAFSKNEDKAIIDECEAGEDAAMKNYREAVTEALPAEILQVVQRQFAGVQEAHGIMRDLKHGKAASLPV